MVEDPARIREAEAAAAAAIPQPAHEPAPQPDVHFGPFDPPQPDAQRPADDGTHQQLIEHWVTSGAYAIRPTASFGSFGHEQGHLPANPETTTALELWPGPARVPQQPVEILPQPLSPHSQVLADCLHAGRVMDGHLAI